ncbi:hypothetical protein [Shimazuella kribbensis]|uniref:hypothetical protein n=1 Tax=Shimazuella kribbensis TaxID=139808 RepID=UPI0004919958|nr:hypothetical protein [Shimazuella kribbensis]
MNRRQLPTHSLYKDAYQQFNLAIYQLISAYQTLLKAYGQRESSHSELLMKKLNLISDQLYHLCITKHALWFIRESKTYHPSSKNVLDSLEKLKAMLHTLDEDRQSKKITRRYTRFQSGPQKGRKKGNGRK